MDEYVTDKRNLNPDELRTIQIQPVAQKKLNAFGIELGDELRVSKDFWGISEIYWGRIDPSARRGSAIQFDGYVYDEDRRKDSSFTWCGILSQIRNIQNRPDKVDPTK